MILIQKRIQDSYTKKFKILIQKRIQEKSLKHNIIVVVIKTANHKSVILETEKSTKVVKMKSTAPKRFLKVLYVF